MNDGFQLSPHVLADLFRTSSNALVALDGDGRIVQLDDHAVGLLGVVREDAIGRPFALLVDGADRASVDSALSQVDDHPGRRGDRFVARSSSSAGGVRHVAWRTHRSGVDDAIYLVGSDETAAIEARQKLQDREVLLSFLVSELQVLRERQRGGLADGIHDGVLQELAAASLVLDCDEGCDACSSAHALVRRATDGLRRVLESIAPIHLEGQSIDVVLRALAAESRAARQLEFDLGVGDVELPIDVRLVAYRLVEELLANCAAHAEAEKVVVRSRASEAALVVEVVDDGVGMDLAAGTPDRTGLGLHLLQERVRALGGRTEVRAARGAGTAVRIELPTVGWAGT